MYTPNISAGKINTMDSEILLEEEGFYRFGIVIGSIKSKNYDQEILELVAGHGYNFDFRFSTLFSSKRLVQNQQVRLTNYNRCYFINDFVIGFCKIYMPKAEISMHITSHNEQENQVVWEIDEIIGDRIWEKNMRPSVYTESGEGHGPFLFGSTYNEYLSVGDQIYINTHKDGYFRIVIREVVSNDILFESSLVKF